MTGSRTSVRSRAWSFLRARARVLLLLAGWSLLESAQTFLSGYGVARALDNGFLAGRTDTGLWWLAAAAGAIVVSGLATRQVFRGLADLVEPLRDGLVRSVVTRAVTRSLDDSGRAADSAAVSQLTNQTEMARDSFAGLVLVARSFVFTAVGALVGLASLDTQLLLIVLPPLVAGLALFLATLAPMAARQEAFLRADEALSARFGTIASGVRDVVACGSQGAVAGDTHRMIDAEADAARSLARWAAVRTLALGIAGQLPIGLLLLCAPWLLDRGLSTGSLLGALTYLTQALLPALHTLMNALGAAGTRLLVVLRRLTDDTPPGHASIVGRSVAPAAGGQERPVGKVEVTGLTFAYGPEAAPVLCDLHLTIEAGEHWAVVGPSGIGKSTLTALIAGVLTPDRGRITVGGCEASLATGEDPSLRRVLIPQQAYVFTGTLRENLLYLCARGAPAEAVRASVQAVGLGPLARRIGGLDAPLDPASLSQGERQLIALGRAHLSPAPLVLLDEATCHLDPAAEAQVEGAFAQRFGTLIVVAHRISSARRADRILLLDGIHATQGSHQELLAASALYQDLVGRWHASHL
ncbi:ABC transporter ATP-binding protein [Streptomyces sp. So13.3]|uniref:ATP-binding cassette domain-containing protein n=1 Tax=unclassified Streptomyces TaxID=2593676 RepID=UPI0011063B15|nr:MULTISPECIES: ABC transporter ATP-binding protein [unclassified Streptomyces]MCZ4102200.1 ABC transporter ATP-binding protein [Streptomyces sp. H39-C1]QNA70621.1 ABC transporter ATP-binding protein [Streptomyces sp. So13.3]